MDCDPDQLLWPEDHGDSLGRRVFSSCFWDHYGLGLSLNSLFSNHVILGNKFPQLISAYQIEISKCSIFVWWGMNETGYDQYRRPCLEPETNAVSFWRYFQVYGQYRALCLESETKAVSFWRYCQVCVPNSSITFMVISRKIKLNNKVSHMIFFQIRNWITMA